MSNYSLIVVIFTSLSIQFLLAFWAEKKAKSKWINNPIVYSLSLAVFCSAWTYYGSVGVAASSGVSFLTTYLGPVIAAPLWIVLYRKIIRICRQQNISSIADFISLRYGNNRFLGALVTLICILGVVPYISLQLKAVSATFGLMTVGEVFVRHFIFTDYTFYIAVFLGLFAAFYSTRNTDATKKHRGLMAMVAVESILKLVFFLIIGVYVIFFMFDGTNDIYQQVTAKIDIHSLLQLNSLEEGFDWSLMIFLSFTAIFLLPRQFQVGVLENTREKHLKYAIWIFPLYLLLFNVFVIFIAWAGIIKFGQIENAEYYSLLLPLHDGKIFLSTLVFLGGFSAAISMIVVSTFSLSTMVSNNIVIPYGFLNRLNQGQVQKNELYIKIIRRTVIFLITIAAYFFYRIFTVELSLFSTGLISFIVIAQLAPSFFLGMFWNRGSSKAAIVGIIIGTLITIYTLIMPLSLEIIFGNNDFMIYGPFHLSFLKPNALFGLDFLNPPAQTLFWSLSFNLLAYLGLSVLLKGNYRERNYAEMFVDTWSFDKLGDNAFVWKGEAYVADIKKVLIKFLGVKRTERAFDIFFRKYNLSPDIQLADSRLISFSEKLLTKKIGGVSAKILIANVVKEEEISLVEVLKILEESKEAFMHNKVLTDKSNQLSILSNKLKEANRELILKDKQKDEFLDTVAHELKTPVTGIKASTEVLLEDIDNIPEELRQQFMYNIINETDRLTRLINDILDFEKLETNRITLNLEEKDIKITIEKVLKSFYSIALKEKVNLVSDQLNSIRLYYDEDRIIQVLTNLFGNAFKFIPIENGEIEVRNYQEKNHLVIEVIDNGKGINEEDFDYIFDKFYQSNNQNIVKPEGSGLGLAICKKIIEKHQGRIEAVKAQKEGTTIKIIIPIKKDKINE